jgi:DNA polymerase-4
LNDVVRRLVLHVDVDAFFPSVEQLLVPALRGRPVIVGSGVIASCSYEARRFGLHAGMSLAQARRLCPQAIVLEGNYQTYRCFAEQVWTVCRRHTTALETFLDEAYGDATGIALPEGGPIALGRQFRQEVLKEVGLSVSVGLAANRMMAKIASAAAKPGRQPPPAEPGVLWIPPGQEEAFLAPLPIRKLPGVGHKTEERLHDLNIRTIGDLRVLDRRTLSAMFGRRGEALHDRCRGQRIEAVTVFRHADGDCPHFKTVSRETTFHRPTTDPGEIRGILFYLTERAMRTARQSGLLSRCVELSIRYDDWKEYAAARTLPHPTDSEDDAFAVVVQLLERLHRRRVALRHVGIVLSRFSRAADRAELFPAPGEVHRRQLHGAVDRIRDRFGHAAVVMGRSIELLGRLERNDYGFVLRTPSLTK